MGTENMLLTVADPNYVRELMKQSTKLFNKQFTNLTPELRKVVVKYVEDKMNPEVWLPVIYEGFKPPYEISNQGRVRNSQTHLILAEKTSKDGYKMLNLYISEKRSKVTTTVHKLVGNAFLDNPENKPVINHMNGDKGFNWACNLQYASYAENTQHAISMGLQPSSGVDNPNNKFSEAEIHQVCKLLETMEPTAISKLPEITVSKAVIASIKLGRTWTDISKQYNIPKPVNVERPAWLKDKMVEVIKSGGSVDDILKATGLENVSKEREYIGLFRRRFLKANPEYVPKQ